MNKAGEVRLPLPKKSEGLKLVLAEAPGYFIGGLRWRAKAAEYHIFLATARLPSRGATNPGEASPSEPRFEGASDVMFPMGTKVDPAALFRFLAPINHPAMEVTPKLWQAKARVLCRKDEGGRTRYWTEEVRDCSAVPTTSAGDGRGQVLVGACAGAVVETCRSD